MNAKLVSIILLFYSAIITAVVPFLKILGQVSPKLRAQLANRPSVDETARCLQAKRKDYKHAVLFFCSSAGEFEQARPIIDRLLKRGDTFVHTMIFSRSGYDYAIARKETVSYSLAPLTDSVWHWGWIFSALRPAVIAIVRHEIWPGFTQAAKNYAPIYLIDASQSLGEQNSRLKKLARSTLLRMFKRIFTVSEEDARFFHSQYSVPQDQIVISGDTKYDRALERATASVQQLQDNQLFSSTSLNRLIIGSAHKPDLEILLNAVRLDPTILKEWQIVVAPHHIDSDNISTFRRAIENAGIEVRLFSKGEIRSNVNDIVILDTMGMLAEAYRHGTAAFVGGASHYQVHNVLEPAIHGLALAWGPFYKNSQEAIYLTNRGTAHIVSNAQDFKDWLHSAKSDAHTATENTNPTSLAVRSLCGASDMIFKEWDQDLHG